MNEIHFDAPLSSALVEQACAQHPWFTPFFVKERWNVLCAMQGGFEESLRFFSRQTAFGIHHIAIVAAGNIPLVCAHDVVCALAYAVAAWRTCRTPVRITLKLSSKDAVLMSSWCAFIRRQLPSGLSLETVGQLPNQAPDVLLFSGGEAARAHYESRWEKVPVLARTSRTSVALLPAVMQPQDWEGLAYDCFSYFGLGCRNTTNFLVPRGMDLSPFIQACQAHPFLGEVRQHAGFAHAYSHAKAIAVMEGEPFVDGGFFLLQPSASLFPPLATVFYMVYDTLAQALDVVAQHTDTIQGVIGPGHIPFGQAQFPSFTDFADNLNTLEWLAKLS